MRAFTSAVIERGGRLAELRCEPPLTVRQVHSDDTRTCALCLVGTAAGPLAGDDLALDLTVRDGAHATLQAAGATIAQGGGGSRSMYTAVTLGARARLVAHPGAVIVARGSRVDITVCLDLAADAAAEWHELLVLGRTGEDPGAATLRWNVTRGGRAILRQFVDLADPALAAWRGMTAGRRVLATALICDPTRPATTVVHSATAVTARLDEHTSLLTVLAHDTAEATVQLSVQLSAVRRTAPASVG
jgi:urease accessory protein